VGWGGRWQAEQAAEAVEGTSEAQVQPSSTLLRLFAEEEQAANVKVRSRERIGVCAA
jgi:hypothetical protein